MHEAILFGLEQGKLHDKALRGIISLIPKKSSDTRILKSFRPLTILNTDYKLVEKVFAERLKSVLDDLINKDQEGFMKGRKIYSNIRRIYDLILLSQTEDVDGCILSLDYLKCFDRVEINSLIGALKFFDFGDNFCNWSKCLFNQATARVINGGHLSERIRIERGLKQGGPSSPYYFLICAETLAILLRNNDNIKGFNIADFNRILGQFADDMDMYLLFEQNTINAVMSDLEYFRKQSGFQVNYDKTILYKK